MTFEELRKLADEATPGPWGIIEGVTWRVANEEHEIAECIGAGATNGNNARLIALAPDLARLCAELGEALEYYARKRGHPVSNAIGWDSGEVATAALAKLAELEAR